MSFFNKISEKISSGATAVSDSTKRMSEIAKLNSKINKNLSEVNNRYTEIGRIVKLELVDKIDHEDVKRIAAEIDTLLAEVNDSRQRISDLKGVKVCDECGAQISKEVAFCPNCGKKQPVVETAEPIAQTSAEVIVPETKTESEENAEKAESIVEEIEKPVDKKDSVFCSQCGNKEDAGIKFCSQCGNKID